MQLSEAHYQQIEPVLPGRRGNVSLSNLDVLNAVPYVAEHGCERRELPKRLGSWHTIYTRMSRWAKAAVRDRVVAELQRKHIIQLHVKASLRTVWPSRSIQTARRQKKRTPGDR